MTDTVYKAGHTRNYLSLPSWSVVLTILIFTASLIWSVAGANSEFEHHVEVTKEKMQSVERQTSTNQENISELHKDILELKWNLRALMESQGLKYQER
jgi:hypothetical protein